MPAACRQGHSADIITATSLVNMLKVLSHLPQNWSSWTSSSQQIFWLRTDKTERNTIKALNKGKNIQNEKPERKPTPNSKNC